MFIVNTISLQWISCDRVGVFLSGQGSAVQAAGAECQRNPAEDHKWDDWIDWAENTHQTQSAQLFYTIYLFIPAQFLQSLSILLLICLSVSFFWLIYLVSSYFSLSHSLLYFYFSFPCCPLCFLISFLLLTISRSRSPLCEHDSTDQRQPAVLLLGGGQDTFLHRQCQHGVEISCHSIVYIILHYIRRTKKHKYLTEAVTTAQFCFPARITNQTN